VLYAGAVFKPLKRFLVWMWYFRARLPLLNFPIPIRLPYGGHTLVYPDEIGYSLFTRKSPSYEEGSWRFITKTIQSGMVCIDVGANQGFYTILLSRRVGENGTVFGFEPVPLEFKRLKINLWLNRCRNTVLENAALSSASGFTDMNVCIGHESRSSFRPPPAEVISRVRRIRVPVVALDEYVKRHDIQKIDFVKIDAEGSEQDVLIGASHVLKTSRPLILIEMADVTTLQFGYPAVELYSWIETNGFKMFDIAVDGFLTPAQPKSSYRENMIAIPGDKVEAHRGLIRMS
jgi:FkbM family methyltransferase